MQRERFSFDFQILCQLFVYIESFKQARHTITKQTAYLSAKLLLIGID